jgi:uncharacterized damage-inducible protein DinB
MLEQLVESWQINHRVTLKLLDALSDEAPHATLSTRGGPLGPVGLGSHLK